MSEPKPNGTDLFMAIVSGMSGSSASERWVLQELQNDVTWLSSELTRMKDENARLKAEVERLTKAGDVMASDLKEEFGDYDSANAWNAAKEGKGQR